MIEELKLEEGLLNCLENDETGLFGMQIAASTNLNTLSDDEIRALYVTLLRATKLTDKNITNLAKVQIGRVLVSRLNDIPAGLNYITQAAEDGSPIAQNYLGGWYINEENAEYDSQKAIYWWEKAAELGSEKALHSLGARYLIGVDVECNPIKGLSFIEKAADLGFAESQILLATIYLEGAHGVPINSAKAIEWMKKASDQDNASAHYSLADYYLKINNMEQAFHYFNLAAKSGYGNSQLFVALMYRDGIGVDRNIDKAIESYITACNNLDSEISREAKMELGCIYNSLEKFDKAISWWDLAAQDGHTGSQYNLALAYAYGDQNVAIDPDKAMMYLNMIDENREFVSEHNDDLCGILAQITRVRYTRDGII